MKHKLIAIVGPTASGKSDLGIKLSKLYTGEIVSVDSRQVYEKMDIGTGKVEGVVNKSQYLEINLNDKKTRTCPLISEEVKHWLIDVANPVSDIFSAAQFQDIAYQIIFKLFHKKITPILVGGTGLYMDAVLEGYQFPKTSIKLRRELEKFSTRKLLAELKKIDPDTFHKIDKSNRIRVLRAVESFLVNRKPHIRQRKKKPKFEYIIFGVKWPRKELYQRIDDRVDERIKQGMVDEIRRLHENGVTYKKLFSFGLEYRYVSQYLQGKMSRTEMIQTLKYKIHAFARRQLTWWRKNNKIIWLDAKKDLVTQAKKHINNFL